MILQKIVAATRARLEVEMAAFPLKELEARAFAASEAAPPRPFAAALKHPDRLGLIAEIKKASPSKGLIAPDFDPAQQAALYRDSLADCLSVLTEPDHFLGELSHLTTAREVAGKPCLRKDFMVDQWQVAQARLAGADCILLIAAVLKDWEIRQLKAAAKRFGMDALVEVHNEEEAKRAVGNGAQFIGVNHRNLGTFQLDLSLTERLRPLLPATATVVAESGIFTREDARRMRDAGADALLVGESLMRSDNVKVAIEELLLG